MAILQIKRFTSLESLGREFDALKGAQCQVVISTIQDTDRLRQFFSQKGARSVFTESELLFHALRDMLGLAYPHHVDERAYVVPTILDISNNRLGNGAKIVGNWLMSSRSALRDRMGIILAPAGFGKTAFSKHLTNKFREEASQPFIALYISRDHWRDIISRKNLFFRDILSEAMSTAFPSARFGVNALELLVAKNVVVPIFDGFDELCADAFYSQTCPKSLNKSRSSLTMMTAAVRYC